MQKQISNCKIYPELNRVIKTFFLLAIFLILPKFASAASAPTGLLFETNFDGYTWNTSGSLDGTECDQTTGNVCVGNSCSNPSCSNAPQGFTNYRDIKPGSGTVTTPWASVSSLPSSGLDHTSIVHRNWTVE